jgi:UPF0755 protein
MKAFAALCVVVLLAAGGAYGWFHWATTTPMSADSSLVVFEVPKGATLNQVGASLVKAGFLRSELLFKIWLKLHPKTPAPKAGKHEIHKAMNLAALMGALASKPLSEDIPITLVPGWRLRDVDKYLVEKGLIDPGEYIQGASDKGRFQPGFVIEGESLAGYLFPETYLVPPGKLDVSKLIERQLERFKLSFAEPHAEEIKESGRSLHTIVVVASLLEREEPKPEMRPEVAGVIFKRLNLNQPLGIDATSRFMLDDWNDERGFIRLLKDPNDPYNTRLRPGLPPGPIGEPSLESLLGATRGKPGKWLYYLHDKNGNVHFGRDGDEHDRNRKKYNVW